MFTFNCTKQLIPFTSIFLQLPIRGDIPDSAQVSVTINVLQKFIEKFLWNSLFRNTLTSFKTDPWSKNFLNFCWYTPNVLICCKITVIGPQKGKINLQLNLESTKSLTLEVFLNFCQKVFTANVIIYNKMPQKWHFYLKPKSLETHLECFTCCSTKKWQMVSFL